MCFSKLQAMNALFIVNEFVTVPFFPDFYGHISYRKAPSCLLQICSLSLIDTVIREIRDAFGNMVNVCHVPGYRTMHDEQQWGSQQQGFRRQEPDVPELVFLQNCGLKYG